MGTFQSKFTKKTTKYVINGHEYASLDEIPEQFRAMFEDRDGDGLPDVVQQHMEAGRHVSARSIEMRSVNGVTTYKVGDREYRSLDEMPPEHRELFEHLAHAGLPDRVPNVPGIPAPERPAMPRRHDPLAELQSSGRKGMDVGSLLLLLGFALLAAVVAAVCWAVLS